MNTDETRKLLEAHHLTAYDIERQSGHVTEQAITAAILEARRAALEEAARIHIPLPPAVPGFVLCRDDYNSGHQGGQVELRQAIRALLDQEPTP